MSSVGCCGKSQGLAFDSCLQVKDAANGERSRLKPVSSLQTLLKEPGVLLNLKTALLLGALLFCPTAALQAAATAPEPEAPAKPELLVEGGLLGAISSSIDDVQEKLDLNQNLIDAWRLRADRAADEVGRLVDQTSERSPWTIAGNFLLLSGVWIGAFTLLTLLGRFIVQRMSRRPFVARRGRLQAVLGYVLPYTIPALICLPLTLYVSHFLPSSIGRALALCFAYATSSGIFSTSMLLCVIVMFNVGHKRPAVQIIRSYGPTPLFLIGFLAALSDALTSPQIARQFLTDPSEGDRCFAESKDCITARRAAVLSQCRTASRGHRAGT